MFDKYDKPQGIKPETKYRIVGPHSINGMNIYRVHELIADGLTGRQIGPDCFSFEQAVELARDLVSGKISFFMGGVPFKKKGL